MATGDCFFKTDISNAPQTLRRSRHTGSTLSVAYFVSAVALTLSLPAGVKGMTPSLLTLNMKYIYVLVYLCRSEAENITSSPKHIRTAFHVFFASLILTRCQIPTAGAGRVTAAEHQKQNVLLRHTRLLCDILVQMSRLKSNLCF